MNRPVGRVRAPLAAAFAVAVAVSLGRLRRVEIEGDSMRPTLDPGDRVVVVRARRARGGDLVAMRDPRTPERLLVKRVVATTFGGYLVAGDNPEASTDSRHFGPVAPRHLLGRAVYRYAPEHRRGRL